MFGCITPKAYILLAWALLFACAGAFAQAATEPPPAAERSSFASTFTAEKLWYWQRRLNLQDWTISVIVARATDLKPKTLGNIHWDSEKKTALIRVLDPADYHMSVPDMLD